MIDAREAATSDVVVRTNASIPCRCQQATVRFI